MNNNNFDNNDNIDNHKNSRKMNESNFHDNNSLNTSINHQNKNDKIDKNIELKLLPTTTKLNSLINKEDEL